MKKAGIDLKKAVELSPNDVLVVRNLAEYYAKNEEYITALKFFKRSEKISRDPLTLSWAFHDMGYEIYLSIGAMDKALYFINKANEMNPLRESYNLWYYLLTGKFQKVLEIIRKSNRNPGLVYSFMRGKSDSAVLYLGQLEAERKVKEGENYNAETASKRYGLALIEVGRTDEGMAIINYHSDRIEQLIKTGKVGGNDLYGYAMIYSFLGETDKAIKYLKRFDENYPWGQKFYMMQVDHLFDNLRDHREYQKIVNNHLDENTRIREEINRLEAAGEL